MKKHITDYDLVTINVGGEQDFSIKDAEKNLKK